MKRILQVAVGILATLTASAAAQPPKGKAGPPPVVSPEVKADRTVTFRLHAPKREPDRPVAAAGLQGPTALRTALQNRAEIAHEEGRVSDPGEVAGNVAEGNLGVHLLPGGGGCVHSVYLTSW